MNIIGPLVALGRWDEALDLVEKTLQLDPPPAYRGYLSLWRAEVALLRGDSTVAAGCVQRARAAAGDHLAEPQVWLPLARLDLELAAARGEPGAALAALHSVLPRVTATRFPRYAWPLLATGARLVAEDTAGQPGSTLVAELRDALERQGTGRAVLGVAQPAHRATLTAELARADGRDDIVLWDAAVTAWECAREPYRLGYATYRAGAAAIAAGERAAATQRLGRAATIAADLRAQPLLDQIVGLARRGRIGLADRAVPPPRSSDGFSLTPRELDVLRLVAAGHSNGQIAKMLFISPKTASVHVSNILAKLGVESRGAAAAVAHEHAIL